MKSRISLPIRMTIGMVLGVAAGLADPSMALIPYASSQLVGFSSISSAWSSFRWC